MVQKDDYAIVAGINEYPEDENLQTLEGACNDANDFVSWLIDSMGVPPANIQKVPKSDNQQADLKRLTNAFKYHVKLCLKNEDAIGRRLYIFLAGHGVGPDVEEASLLPADADLATMPSYHLAGRRYANYLRKLAAFYQVLLFMDCCRDKLRNGQDGMFPFDDSRGDSSANKVHHFYAFASGFDKKTREELIDGRKRGIFTYKLLNGLKGAASTKPSGRIMASDLKRYLEGFVDLPPPSIGRDFLIVGTGVAEVTIKLTLVEPNLGLEILGPDKEKLVPGVAIAEEMEFKLPTDRTYQFGVPSDAEGQYVRVKYVDVLQEDVNVSL